MRVQFSETDLMQQMRIKTLFDPAWLLNPAKVFPLEGRPEAAGRSDSSAMAAE
jgi:glycolate oxidase